MGGLITLDPVDPIPSGRGWRTHLDAGIGSGSALGATYLADTSDSTYIHDTVSGVGVTLVLLNLSDPPALPAGAIIKSVTPRVRASQAVGGRELSMRAYRSAGSDATPEYNTPATIFAPNSTIKDFVGGSGGPIPSRVGALSPAEYLSTLRAEVKLADNSASDEDHRVYKVSVDVAYVEPPTVDTLVLVDPADTTSSVRPRLQWYYASPEGHPQYEFRAAIWALADVDAFPGGRATFEDDPENIFGDTSGALGSAGPGYSPDGGTTWVRAKAWSVPSGNSSAGRVQSTDQAWTAQQDIPVSGAMVAYVQSAAQYEGNRLEGPSVASVDFTMAVTPPAEPTQVAAAWQYPDASGSLNRNDQYRTKVTVTVPEGSVGPFTGRRLFVEHCINGVNDWRLMPLSMQEIGSAGGSFTFYDTLPLGGRALRYRARIQLWSNTQTLPSAYRVGNAVDCVIDEFILRNPLDPESTAVLRLQGDLEATRGESVTEFRALGNALPSMVSDTMLGLRWRLQNLNPDEAGSSAFTALRDSRATLLFQTDMPGKWYWVRFGPDVTHRTPRQTNRKNPTKRSEFQDFELVQTFPIPGQPGVWV